MKKAAPFPPGVWIASTDMILSGRIPENFNWSIPVQDAMLFTLRCSSKNAEFCDVIKVRQQDGTVESISSLSQIDESSDLEMNINGGIVYLHSTVADSLLLLSNKYPLDRCTYLGEDNGVHTLQVSFNELGTKFIY